MTRCRTCQAEIEWILLLPGRKRHPINSTPDEGGNIALAYTIGGAATTGVVLSRVAREERLQEGKSLYVSHFATCAQADRWRRRK